MGREKKDDPGWKVHPAADGRGAPAGSRYAAPALLAAARRAAGRQLLDRLDAARTSRRARTSPTRRSSCTRCRPTTSAWSRSPSRRSRASSSSAVTVEQEAVHALLDQPAGAADRRHAARRCSSRRTSRSTPSRPTAGRGLLASILLGFGPTLLILGIIIFALRRATAGGGALGTFGRSKARRYEGLERVTFDDVAGIEEAEQELVEVVDFLKNPGEVQPLGRQDPARRAAHRARRARARRCSRARSPARPACRSSRPARASSSRRSWASAPRACAISSRRPRPRSRRSSSSTSSTRSAARAAAARASAATTSASRRSTRSSPRWTASARTAA